MQLLFKKTEMSTKIKLSCLCGAFVLLWTLFTIADPMLSYAVFGDSIIGSNILLILISLCVTIPLVLLFTVLKKRDIPLTACILSGLVYHLSFIYVYSIFRYDIFDKDRRLFIVLPVIAGIVMDILIFIRGEKTAKNAAAGAVFALIQGGAYLLLFHLALSAMLR